MPSQTETTKRLAAIARVSDLIFASTLHLTEDERWALAASVVDTTRATMDAQ
jgi:hypothetical protein